MRTFLARLVHPFAGFYDWLEGFCSCELIPDLGEEDLDANLIPVAA